MANVGEPVRIHEIEPVQIPVPNQDPHEIPMAPLPRPEEVPA